MLLFKSNSKPSRKSKNNSKSKNNLKSISGTDGGIEITIKCKIYTIRYFSGYFSTNNIHFIHFVSVEFNILHNNPNPHYEL